MPTLTITRVPDDAGPNTTITFEAATREEAIGQLAAWMRERMDWSNDEAPARPAADPELWFTPLQVQIASTVLIECAFTDVSGEDTDEDLRWTLTQAVITDAGTFPNVLTFDASTPEGRDQAIAQFCAWLAGNGPHWHD